MVSGRQRVEGRGGGWFGEGGECDGGGDWRYGGGGCCGNYGGWCVRCDGEGSDGGEYKCDGGGDDWVVEGGVGLLGGGIEGEVMVGRCKEGEGGGGGGKGDGEGEGEDGYGGDHLGWLWARLRSTYTQYEYMLRSICRIRFTVVRVRRATHPMVVYVCNKFISLCVQHDASIGTCFLCGGGVCGCKMLALEAFERSHTHKCHTEI